MNHAADGWLRLFADLALAKVRVDTGVPELIKSFVPSGKRRSRRFLWDYDRQHNRRGTLRAHNRLAGN